jgi:hypothetical protein
MKTPKLLPWLARKHGVTEARAAQLYAVALRRAHLETGEIDTPAYWGAAVARWHKLLEAESRCRPPLAHAVRAYHRIGMLPMVVSQGALLTQVALWSRLLAQRARRAA